MSERRKYTKQFKLDAISLVNEQGYSCSDAAKSLGINTNVISRWVREVSTEKENAFRGNGTLTTEQLEIRRLKEEVRRLIMEKDILKKATAFFAKEIK